MLADAQRDGRPAKYRWRPLPCTTPLSLPYPTAGVECRAVTLPIQENARLGYKVNFARGKIPLGGKSPRKCIYSVRPQETAKHRTLLRKCCHNNKHFS